MPWRPGPVRRVAALVPGLFAAGVAHAACLSITSNPDGALLARLALANAEASFRVLYRHSVTRTPVEERYHLDGESIVQTEIRFEQHGPGLPTEPDPDGSWTRRDGRYVVTMRRRFPRVVMRVHADTQPALVTPMQSMDLAQWGNRSLTLAVVPDPCLPP